MVKEDDVSHLLFSTRRIQTKVLEATNISKTFEKRDKRTEEQKGTAIEMTQRREKQKEKYDEVTVAVTQ